jgi:L-fuculose-phosphate aldolase
VIVLGGEDEVAEAVAAFHGRSDEIARFAAAVLLPAHGVVVAGRDLDHAFDALERVEANARCLLLGALLPTPVNAEPMLSV